MNVILGKKDRIFIKNALMEYQASLQLKLSATFNESGCNTLYRLQLDNQRIACEKAYNKIVESEQENEK